MEYANTGRNSMKKFNNLHFNGTLLIIESEAFVIRNLIKPKWLCPISYNLWFPEICFPETCESL